MVWWVEVLRGPNVESRCVDEDMRSMGIKVCVAIQDRGCAWSEIAMAGRSDPCQRGCLTSHACVMWGPFGRIITLDDVVC